jgi:hypothetical protein
MPRPSIEVARGWRQRTVVDRDGAPLGQIAHIYLDRLTSEPEWALVVTEQDGRRVFVPLVDAAEQEDRVRVPVERTLVSNAPTIRAGRQLSEEETARLHGHYGGAPELRWASARRAPGGGPPARLRQGLGWARERVPSPPAMGSPRARRLLLAAGAVASSVAGGLLLARRRRRSPGLAGAVGRTVGSVLAVPAGMLRRRRRRRRLRALLGTVAAPLTAAGRAVTRTGRRVPVAAQRFQPGKPRRRRRPMAGNLKLLAGLAAGYVLGARAGRERYERIVQASRRLAERPGVRELTGKVRSGLGAGLEKAAGTASDRLQQARGEEGGPGGRSGAGVENGEADQRVGAGGGSPPEPEPEPSGRRPVRSRGGG